jgi:TolB-like protein
VIGTDDAVSDAEARAACEHILSSTRFAKARLMGRLLRYLVAQSLAGNARGTTEYAIGLEVLGRKPADYSPSEDPSVRVQVGRLRRRLETYGTECAQPGDVVIRIPLGGYMPVIERRTARPVPTPLPTRSDALAIRPIHVIAGSAAGQAFAQGLQEELLSQMVQAFGPVVVGEVLNDVREDARDDMQPRTIVSTLRIDPHRLRASVCLMEAPRQRVTWAQQFDQAPSFSIDEQETLATSICQALKRHLALP